MNSFVWLRALMGAFQSVMMDDSSLFVHYDSKRMDCIQCRKCVSVCPTGIDIRNGMQMECIACTACIDACDGVMKKIGRPEGLISYESLRALSGKLVSVLRPRPLVYLFLLFLCLGTLGVRLLMREPVSVEITRAIDAPYQVVRDQDGTEFVLNHYQIHLSNLGWNEVRPQLSLSAEDLNQKIQLIIPPGGLNLEAAGMGSGELKEFDVFLKVPRSIFKKSDSHPMGQLVTHWGHGLTSNTTLSLIGPNDDL